MQEDRLLLEAAPSVVTLGTVGLSSKTRAVGGKNVKAAPKMAAEPSGVYGGGKLFIAAAANKRYCTAALP